ncbi:unnamed protein product [Allacma fusca]|uniref:Uncharacterized protein n=1 Tax=Allacma fusca TaxID=39272 RepID=A0A8J2K144_9HEXA|nr:unnamed protein product [Allacma fusca]
MLDSEAEVPDDIVVVFQIVNHLDVELTDYQLDLYLGSEHQEAPKTVACKTTEVFTFKWTPTGLDSWKTTPRSKPLSPLGVDSINTPTLDLHVPWSALKILNIGKTTQEL